MESSELKNKTAKGILWGGLGNFGVQFMSLVFGIFLARLLNAEDYGIVGLLTIFTQLAGTFCESGFTKALTNRSEIRQKDYVAVFWFSIVVGCSLYVILFFCAPLIARFYNEPRLIALSRYAFISIILNSLMVAPSAYMYKKLMARERTLTWWGALIVSNLVGLFMAFKGFAHWGIVTQSILYVMMCLIGTYYFSGWRPRGGFSFEPIREMFPYSVKLLLTRLVNIINGNIFVIFLAKFFSLKIVGNYNQANKWGIMGYSLVTTTMRDVTHPVLASIDPNDRQRHYEAFRKMMRFTAFVSFPAMFGFALAAREFIVILITEKWLDSAVMLSILSVGYAFFTISYVFSEVVAERGRSDWYMYISIVAAAMQLACLFLLHPYGIKVMLLSSVAVQLIVLGMWFLFIRREMGYGLWHFIRDVFSYAAIAAICVAVGYFLVKLTGIHNLYATLFMKIFMVAGLYIGILYAARSVMLRESYAYLRDAFKGKWKKVTRRK